METTALPVFRDRLLDRRRKLQDAAAAPHHAAEMSRLLREVDAALGRIELGTFGLCEVCTDPVETDRLLADPLTRFCLDHLTPAEQSALERDLQLASRIQRELLPGPETRIDGWDIAYHYEPAGPVSGDYCDLIPADGGQVYFVVADIEGKGVAAAMLMSHLRAMLRALVPLGFPLDQLMERAGRIFCESTLSTHFATLVCGRANPSGDVEIANAGHPPPLVIRAGGVEAIDADGLPIGMFRHSRFSPRTVRLAPGDMLLLYTDGLLEAVDHEGAEYGAARLSARAAALFRQPPAAAVESYVQDVTAFRGARGPADDLTIMAVQRTTATETV